MRNKQYVTLLILMTGLVTQVSAMVISTKERPGYLRPRTVVYVYNPIEQGNIGYSLAEKFTVKSNKAELDDDAYYPRNNEILPLKGPTIANKSGVTIAAEFNRNHGIKNGTTYIFTQTINLEGIGSVVEFKQRLIGDIIGSDMEYGIAAPQFGIKETWFDEDNTDWHQIEIPHLQGARLLGTYVIHVRAYNGTLFTNAKGDKSVWGKIAQGTAIVTSSAILAGGGVGLGEGAKISSRGQFEYERVAERTNRRISPGEAERLAPENFEEANAQKARGSKVTTASAVTMGAAAVTLLASIASLIPSYYPNILYKIEYIQAGVTRSAP
jgi:hypothetical protein